MNERSGFAFAEEFTARILPYACSMFVCTVASWYAASRSGSWLWWLLCIVPLVVWLWRTPKWRLLGSLFLVVVCYLVSLMVAHYEAVRIFQPPTGAVSFRGTVSEMPDLRFKTQYLTVTPNGWGNAAVRIKVAHDGQYRYGDVVSVSGIAEIPQTFVGNSGTVFDYPRYLAVRDIVVQVRAKQVSVVGYAPNLRILAFLYHVHDLTVARFTELLPEYSRGLVLGVVLGDRSLLSDEDIALYRIVGLSHVIVLSGFNVTILAEACTILGCWTRASRAAVLISSALLVTAFVLFAGASASLLRAGIMIGVVILARTYYRRSAAWRGLLYAVVIMLAMNPRILFDDIGFELSALATAGLIFLQKRIAVAFAGIPERFDLREVVSTTLAATIPTTPIVFFRIGSVAGLGLFGNILVVWLVPIMMLASTVMLFVSFVSLWLGKLLGIAVGWTVWYVHGVSAWIASKTPRSILYNTIYFFASVVIVYVVSLILEALDSQNQKTNQL